MANEVNYHPVEVTGGEICRQTLTGLPPTFNFVNEWFAFVDTFSFNKLKIALDKAEELNKQPDGTDGHALAAGFKP